MIYVCFSAPPEINCMDTWYGAYAQTAEITCVARAQASSPIEDAYVSFYRNGDEMPQNLVNMSDREWLSTKKFTVIKVGVFLSVDSLTKQGKWRKTRLDFKIVPQCTFFITIIINLHTAPHMRFVMVDYVFHSNNKQADFKISC